MCPGQYSYCTSLCSRRRDEPRGLRHQFAFDCLECFVRGGRTHRTGSLRHLRQYRGKTLVQEIDAYDLLLHGIHREPARLQAGDTLLVPPLGAEVTIGGMVRRPAIYELDGENSLAEVLELAGGVLSSEACGMWTWNAPGSREPDHVPA